MSIPGSGNPLLLTGGDYQISRSLRFRSSASAYLNRTFGAPTSSTIFTFSTWMKRGTLGTAQALFGTNAQNTFYFDTDNKLYVAHNNVVKASTTAVYRDPSAWYHIVYQQNGSAITIYVNNVSAATGTGSPFNINTAIAHYIGYGNTGANFDGYLADINFIDGQALTQSSFGETDATTGVWQPKAYTGTYGTNGFWLKFTDVGATSGSNAGYGKDFAGTNYWTTNNLSSTAGVTYDSMIDTPTPFDNGGTGVGNYATLNPLSTTAGTYDYANLRYVGASAWRRTNGTIAVSSGKWYWEVTIGTAPYTPRANNTAYNIFGFGLATVFNDTTASSSITNAVYLGDNGYYKNFSNALTDSGVAIANGDVLSVAVDLDANTFTFYQNNVSRVTGTIGATAGTSLVPMIHSYDGSYGLMYANFGQRPFTYTPPSGFKALNTQNLPTPTIAAGSAHMNVALDTGANIKTTSQALYTYYLEWIKDRANVNNHQLIDTVRGSTAVLQSNVAGAETTYTAPTGNSVGWVWNANQTSASNTSGSITSTVSANTTAGFSVVTYTGTGANATVGHGLGVAPSMVITKTRTGTTAGWGVWHVGLTSGAYYLELNTTAAQASLANMWNSTTPTSSVFSVGSNGDTNASTQPYVAYCFAAVASFSSAFSFTGNGSSDGIFVYLGFLPRLILLKRTDTTGNWYLWDTARNTYNALGNELYPNLSDAEVSATDIDVLSNGFKIRNSTAGFNANNGTYIGFAWAKNPFKYSLGF